MKKKCGFPETLLPTSRLAPAPLPHVWFDISAVFHHRGPSVASLLFTHVGVLGMALAMLGVAIRRRPRPESRRSRQPSFSLKKPMVRPQARSAAFLS
jgi:hypothetical protein